MSERMTIHELIDQRLRTMNITPKVLASHLNVTESSISRWRRGIAEPNPQHWPDLFALLQISPEEVLPPASGRFIPNALIHHTSLPDEKTLKQGFPARQKVTEQSMVDTYEARLQDMRDALERAERSRIRLEDHLEELREDNRGLHKQLAEMTAENIALMKKNNELQIEILTLKTEISHPLTPGRAVGES